MNSMESTSNMNSLLNMRSSTLQVSGGGGGSGGPQQLDLPPGFRFHPTDEELVLHYLKNKVSSRPLPVPIITEIDLYKFDPWDLPGKAICGESEWYFFTPRDRKYPNGARPNRAAGSGYWKATGTDKPINTVVCAGHPQGASFQQHQHQQQQHVKLGVKKALVFYKGRPPKGVKTNWIMHEYRLVPDPSSSKVPSFSTRRSLRLDDWVLCRIYRKSSQATRVHTGSDSNSCVEEGLETLPDEDMQQDEANVGTNIYNDTRQLPRYGSLGRLVMGSMDNPYLDSLVIDQVSTSNMNPLNISNLPFHAHNIHDSQSSWPSNLGHLDSNNMPTTVQNSNTLFARVSSDDSQKGNASGSSSLNIVDNMGLNIGLASIFPSMRQHHQQQHLQQHQQQQAPCEDTNTSGGEGGDNTNIRWPFGDSRPKFPFA